MTRSIIVGLLLVSSFAYGMAEPPPRPQGECTYSNGGGASQNYDSGMQVGGPSGAPQGNMPTQRPGIPNPKINQPVENHLACVLASLQEYQEPSIAQVPAFERPPSPSLEPSYPELLLVPPIQRILPLAQRILDFERRAQNQFPTIRIPYDGSIASQEMTPEALRLRARVEAGETIYRLGTRRINETGDTAQFWSLENPTNPGYAQRHAMPPQNYRNANFIERGILRRGSPFVTKRVSPYTNLEGETFTGDGYEVVVPEGSVQIEGHLSL